MKLGQKKDEYVKKEDLDQMYEYQKVAFDLKIDEVNKVVEKVRDIISIKFGENIEENKYENELDKIKEDIKNIDIENNKKVGLMRNKIEASIQGKLDEIVDNTIKQADNKLAEIEKSAVEMQQKIKEDSDEFNIMMKQMEMNARDKTLLARQEKRLKSVLENSEKRQKENYQKFEEITGLVNNLAISLSKDIAEKIQELHYEQDINSLKDGIEKLEKQLELSKELSGKRNLELEDKIQEELNKKTNILDYTNNSRTINERLDKLLGTINQNEELSNQRYEKIEENMQQELDTKLDQAEHERKTQEMLVDIIRIKEDLGKEKINTNNLLISTENKLKKMFENRLEEENKDEDIRICNEKTSELREMVIDNKQTLTNAINDAINTLNITLSNQIQTMNENVNNEIKAINEKILKLEQKIDNTSNAFNNENKSSNDIYNISEDYEKDNIIELNSNRNSFLGVYPETKKKQKRAAASRFDKMQGEYNIINTKKNKKELMQEIEQIDGSMEMAITPKRSKKVKSVPIEENVEITGEIKQKKNQILFGLQ